MASLDDLGWRLELKGEPARVYRWHHRCGWTSLWYGPYGDVSGAVIDHQERCEEAVHV